MVFLELVKSEIISDDIRHFYFKPSEKIEFSPGNHALLSLIVNEEKITRPFTFVSLPSEEIVSFIIKRHGKFTQELFNSEMGTKIEVVNVYGKYSYDDSFIGKELVCIAGGTGIIPFMCMRDYCKTNNLDVKFKILYSVSSSDEIITNDVEVITLTKETKEGFNSGRIDKEFLTKHLSLNELKESIFLVCGPHVFEDSISKELVEIGAINLI